MPALTKPFDVSFFLGLPFVVAALAAAAVSVGGAALPFVGSGRGPIVAVAVIGMAGCAIAGVSQTKTLGWTDTVMILGSVLGVVALAVIAAPLFGWDWVVRPLASFAPAGGLAEATTEQLALIAVAGLIALKFVINVAYGLVRLGQP